MIFEKLKNLVTSNNILKLLINREEKGSIGAEGEVTGKQILVRQITVIAVAILAIFILGSLILSIGSGKTQKIKQREEAQNKKIKVEVASKALDPEAMWRNHFEEKLEGAKEDTEKQILKFTESLTAKSDNTLAETKNEVKALREELESLREFAFNESTKREEAGKSNSDEEFQKAVEANLLAEEIASDEYGITAPKDNKLYIPETAYITGTLLGGIAVSTSVGSSSEPVPVSIRITSRGNLPKKFTVDLKDCRIMGSAYGDLSSERAVIRAEVLVCNNSITEEIVTTKVAGQVYGDDGMNGVKGRVVDMSSKHIKNAAIGGMLSGFAGTMKSEKQMALTGIGALTTQKSPVSDRLKDNAFEGLGNASEKIADYYIKQAEKMSPVLLIPGGTKVDIMFTKGVYLGSTDVVKKIENERKNARDKDFK